MLGAFYNENEPYAAQWLKNLSEAGHIAPGTIDARSIADVRPKDLEGFQQAHFFAGIGGWSYALRLAGWPDDVPVWTGSCPCTPFSQAGKRRGANDPRHLWPAWFKLIEQCRPIAIFGEQVSGPDGLLWLDAVHDDLEGLGYAVGAADMCAAGVGAPHIRQRLYFVAVSNKQRREGIGVRLLAGRSRSSGAEVAGGSTARELADACGDERGSGRGRTPLQGRTEPGGTTQQPSGRGYDGELADASGERLWRPREPQPHLERDSVQSAQRSLGQRQADGRARVRARDGARGDARGLADAQGERSGQGRADPRRGEERVRSMRGSSGRGPAIDGRTGELGDASGARGGRDAGAVSRAEAQGGGERFSARREPDELAAPSAARLVGNAGSTRSPERPGPEERFGAVRIEGPSPAETGATSGFWADAEWWLCRDGKIRPAQPSAFPLASRVSGRVALVRTREQTAETRRYNAAGALKGIGNAIVPPLAATFIRAVMTAL